jgi:hypothetical protein
MTRVVESHRVPDIATLLQFIEQYAQTELDDHYIRIQRAD